MNKKLIIITGPTASGKTTVAKLLCKKYKKCVRLDIDRVKHFVESGFKYNETKEGVAQWNLCAENVILLTRNYLKNGYTVIIEGVLGNIGDINEWEKIFRQLKPEYKFLLTVSKEKLYSRDKMRDKKVQMGKKDVGRHFSKFSGTFYKDFFEVIENNNINKTVECILRYVR